MCPLKHFPRIHLLVSKTFIYFAIQSALYFDNFVSMNNDSIAWKILSWIFGILVFAAGIVNLFWGDDPFFGVFILLLSLVYFLPVNTILRKIAGFTIPRMGVIKVILGIFIIWATVGVGELFDKIELMVKDL